LLAAILLAAVACATYTSRMQTARDLYFDERYDDAVSGLTALIEDASNRDASLLYVERGKANLAAGRYESAIVDLQRAERRFLEIENTRSPSESFKSLLINPTMGEYQADPHEKIMINAYLCLAYWLKGEETGALVERNRVIARLEQYLGGMPAEERAAFDVPFARYLAAVMYEIEGRVDDARIEYEAIARASPGFEPPLIDPKRPELIVFAETGRAPVLVSTEIRGYLQKEGGALVGVFNMPGIAEPQTFSMVGYADLALDKSGVLFTFAFPRLVEQPRPDGSCVLVADGMEAGELKPLDDFEGTARAVYGRKLPGTLLKAALRTYLKTFAQKGLVKDEDSTGRIVADVAGKIFAAVDRADTRSWQTLPAEIRYFRMEIPEGVASVSARCGGIAAEGLEPPDGSAAKRIVFISGLP
jgi:tetratricopeptide (TPR) repeat protein